MRTLEPILRNKIEFMDAMFSEIVILSWNKSLIIFVLV